MSAPAILRMSVTLYRLEVWVPGLVSPSLNRLLRLHWAERRQIGRQWAEALHVLVRATNQQLPAIVLERCRIGIERQASPALDLDNLVGGVKPLIDALLVASARHPYGLGILRDDASGRLELDIRQRPAPRAQRGTLLSLQELT